MSETKADASPTKTKPYLLHLGTLQAGGVEVVTLKGPIPPDLGPIVVNVRIGDGGRVAIGSWTSTYVEVVNDGKGPSSYMLFAGNERMHRGLTAAGRLVGAFNALRGKKEL